MSLHLLTKRCIRSNGDIFCIKSISASQFWPVENGERVAVFSMEKNCRLLHSYRSIFGKEEIIKKAQSFTPFADKALLLCPDGKLLTFEIPFPSLIK